MVDNSEVKFNKELYIEEMKELVDSAINLILKNDPEFEFYTVSIWTDPNAAYSSIGFETKRHSDEKIITIENLGRNYNPADYEFPDYVGFEHNSFDENWEEESAGACWNELELSLKIIGTYALDKLKSAKKHVDFELSTNGPLDWYQFIWK